MLKPVTSRSYAGKLECPSKGAMLASRHALSATLRGDGNENTVTHAIPRSQFGAFDRCLSSLETEGMGVLTGS